MSKEENRKTNILTLTFSINFHDGAKMKGSIDMTPYPYAGPSAAVKCVKLSKSSLQDLEIERLRPIIVWCRLWSR